MDTALSIMWGLLGAEIVKFMVGVGIVIVLWVIMGLFIWNFNRS